MQINVSGHHVEVTPALREYTESKLSRLEKHFDNITNTAVTLSVEKLIQKAEASVHVAGADLFAAWGEVAPAMGMIGTLIGLVQMLGNMSDPKAIGPAMAVALLTTMYGAILANVIMLPLNMKLVEMAGVEEQNNELIIEGLVFMAEGGNPRVLGDKLAAFCDPATQAKLAAAAG